MWRKSTEKKTAKPKEQIKKELPILKQSLALKWHVPETPQIHHLKKLRKKLYAKAEAEDLDWVTGKGHRKSPLQKAIETVNVWLEKWKKYTQDLHICGDRNSYCKTDHDATFMHMKEDHMRNGQLKPGYNGFAAGNSNPSSWPYCATKIDIAWKNPETSTVSGFFVQ